jgi:RasGEF N-terminal motif
VSASNLLAVASFVSDETVEVRGLSHPRSISLNLSQSLSNSVERLFANVLQRLVTCLLFFGFCCPIQLKKLQAHSYSHHTAFIPLQYGESVSEGLPPIKAATLERLIERLTPEEFVDSAFRKCFLLTYRSFADPTTVLLKLQER